MADVMTSAQRRQCMSQIRSRDTTPELLLRKALWAVGLRGQRIAPDLPGKPDVAFPGARVAVFVDGCFWHGCPAHYAAPKSNKGFWRRKLLLNRRRDKHVDRELVRMRWRVARLWEHEVERNPLRAAIMIRSMVRGATRRVRAS